MLIVAFASMNTAKAQCDLILSNLQVDADLGVQVGAGTGVNDDGGPFRCRTTFTAEFDLLHELHGSG